MPDNKKKYRGRKKLKICNLSGAHLYTKRLGLFIIIYISIHSFTEGNDCKTRRGLLVWQYT